MKKLTKKDFHELYLTKTNKEVCKELDISRTTLFKLLKENEIELKSKGKLKTNNHKLN